MNEQAVTNPAVNKPVLDSRYLTMRDGTRIAVDIWLPDASNRALPIILRQTRYFRSVRLRRPLQWFRGNQPLDHTGLYAKRRDRFLHRGYGWVDVDVRGSGASSGFRTAPWSQPEAADALEIVRWIVQQPWCNGSIGSLGISYDGAAAEWLLCHPQSAAADFPVKAVAPRFSSCDAFSEIGYPGGLRNTGFARRWHELNSALDRNRLSDLVNWPVGLITGGVSPVSGDRWGSERNRAVAEHAENYSVLERMSRIEFADDEATDDREVIDPRLADDGTSLQGSQIISPSYFSEQINASRKPVLGYSGWWDGAYAKAAVLRFLRSPTCGSRLILGPWNHGGGWNVDVRDDGVTPEKEQFDHDDSLIQFFDEFCQPNTGADASNGQDQNPVELPVKYYTMGARSERKWKEAASWPPPSVVNRTLLLTRDQTLLPMANDTSYQRDTDYEFCYSRAATTTGDNNRWQTQARANAKVEYPDRRDDASKRLNFRSPPLENELTVTGHPVVSLAVACDATDASLFVYLEEVTPSGAVRMVTEGLLSLRHRKTNSNPSAMAIASARCGIPYRTFCRRDARPMPVVSAGSPQATDFQSVLIDLLPVSWRFGAGCCYQLSFAMADEGSFEPAAATKMWLRNESARPLTFRLPVEPDPVPDF